MLRPATIRTPPGICACNTCTAQSGDANYAALNFGPVNILGATTTLTVSPSPAVFGNSLTLTATVTSSTGTPTGTVAFLDGATPLTTVALNSAGSASFTTSSLVAGTHTITANYSGGSGFEASSSSKSVSVNPAVLTITADNKTMVFGSAVPALTFTPTGFVNGDTAAVLIGSPQLSTTATSNSPAGLDPITIANGTLSAANYTFVFVNGVMTITQATPIVTVICPSDVDHDDDRHTCRAKVIGVDGKRVRGRTTITYNGSTRPPSKVGTYTVIAAFTSHDPNYTNATGTGTLIIERRHDGDDDHHDHDWDHDKGDDGSRHDR
jgi:hypothetical protein